MLRKLAGFNRYLERARQALGEGFEPVRQLVELMLNLETRRAEIVATLFAGWNNLLLDGKQPTDEEIVYESRENWHPVKLKIERERFFNALDWMRRKSVVPSGKGRRVVEKVK